MPLNPILRHVLTVVLALGLLACGSPVNRENFEKIRTDMSVAEVNDILGEPTESSSVDIGPISGTQATWKTRECTIAIQFLNGKVKAKQFLKQEGDERS